MANVVKDLKTILNSFDRKSIALLDSKTWQEQKDRIDAVFKFVNELEDEEDDLK